MGIVEGAFISPFQARTAGTPFFSRQALYTRQYMPALYAGLDALPNCHAANCARHSSNVGNVNFASSLPAASNSILAILFLHL